MSLRVFVCIYIAHVHTYIVDPVPHGEILRAAFIGMSWLKYMATFQGQQNFEELHVIIMVRVIVLHANSMGQYILVMFFHSW